MRFGFWRKARSRPGSVPAQPRQRIARTEELEARCLLDAGGPLHIVSWQGYGPTNYPLSMPAAPAEVDVTFSSAPSQASVESHASWRLYRDNVEISQKIQTLTLNNAVLTLHFDAVLTYGNYRLVARDTILDSGGQKLDGDQNNLPGGDWATTFTVAPFSALDAYTLDAGTSWSGPQIATDELGNHVVVWAGNALPFVGVDAPGVFAARYSFNGELIGNVMTVSLGVYAQDVSVAMNPAGAFVIAWAEGNTVSGPRVAFQPFTANGSPLAAVQFVPDPNNAWQLIPAVGINVFGKVAVTWIELPAAGGDTGNVKLARYQLNGAIQGSVLDLGPGDGPRVAVSDRELFVSYRGVNNQLGQVWVDRFTDFSGALTDARRVNWLEGVIFQQDIVADRYGYYALVWSQTEGSATAIYAERFSRQGLPIERPIRVDDVTAPTDYRQADYAPRAALSVAGDLYVSWISSIAPISNPGNFQYSIVARQIGSDGVPRLQSFDLGPMAQSLNIPAVAIDGWGVVRQAWRGDDSNPQVGDFSLRLYEQTLPPFIDMNGDLSGLDFRDSVPPGPINQPRSILDPYYLILADADSVNLQSAHVSIAAPLAGDQLLINTATTSLQASYGNGLLTLTGEATVTDYVRVLSTLKFQSSSSRANGSKIDISVRVNDGVWDSPVAHSVIHVYSATAQVVGRRVFYNNSAADGHFAGANAADDLAIAPDKSPVLLGQATGLPNITNYAQGINGIMIDIAGAHGELSADDFEFRLGNSPQADLWTLTTSPLSITTRAGAGINNSDRVTLIWPDGQIKNAWLSVAILATADTRLASTEAFVVGNLVGNVVDSSSPRVSISDLQSLINKILSLTNFNVAANDPYDFNRDNKISPQDLQALINQLLSVPAALDLFTISQLIPVRVPPPAPAALAAVAFGLSVADFDDADRLALPGQLETAPAAGVPPATLLTSVSPVMVESVLEGWDLDPADGLARDDQEARSEAAATAILAPLPSLDSALDPGFDQG